VNKFVQKIHPAVYADSNGARAFNLGEVAEICNLTPEIAWNSLIIRCDLESVPVIINKVPVVVYLDKDGNVYRIRDRLMIGRNVGGNNGKSIGKWEDVYFPEKHGIKWLKNELEPGLLNFPSMD